MNTLTRAQSIARITACVIWPLATDLCAATPSPSMNDVIEGSVILRRASIAADARPFWLELASADDLVHRGMLSPLLAPVLDRPVWLVQSARADGPFIVHGRYAGPIAAEVIDAKSGESLTYQIRDSQEVVLEPPPERDDSVRVAPIRYAANADTALSTFPRLDTIAWRQETLARRSRGIVSFAALLPYGQYKALFEPAGWLYAVAPLALLGVVRTEYPYGFSYPRSGSYYAAETIQLTDAGTGAAVHFGVKGRLIPGTGRNPRTVLQGP